MRNIKFTKKLEARISYGDRGGFINFSIIILLCLISFILVYVVRMAIPDDAFIYLRISQNIADGHGWGFNPGHTSDAATSPFYVLFLSFLQLIGIHGKEALLAAYWIGLSALTSIVYLGSARLGKWTATTVTAAVFLCPELLNAVGLESTIFLSTVALSFWAIEKGSYSLAGVFSGFAALGRPEGVVVYIIGLISSRSSTRNNLKYTLIFIIILIPWVLFSLHEFNSLVPHTAMVKYAQAQSSNAAWSSSHFSWLLGYFHQLPFFPFVLPIIAVGAARSYMDYRNGMKLNFYLVLFGLAQAFGYIALNAPTGYFWYYIPANISYMICLSLGLACAVKLITYELWWEGSICKRKNILILFLVLLYIIITNPINEAKETYWRYTDMSRPYRLSSNYKAIAKWLSQNGNHKAWVAANEIGYIGYYSDMNIRDMLGLLEEGSVNKLSGNKWDWWYTDYPKPKFVVLHAWGGIGEPNAKNNPWPTYMVRNFYNSYSMVYKSGPVYIYERR